jgi:rubredoxin
MAKSNKKSTAFSSKSSSDSDSDSAGDENRKNKKNDDDDDDSTIATRITKNPRGKTTLPSYKGARRIIKAMRPLSISSKKKPGAQFETTRTIHQDEGTARKGGKMMKLERKKKKKMKKRGIFRKTSAANYNSDLESIDEDGESKDRGDDDDDDDDDREEDFEPMPSNNEIVDYNDNESWSNAVPALLDDESSGDKKPILPPPACFILQPPSQPTAKDIENFRMNRLSALPQFEQVPLSTKNKRSREVLDVDQGNAKRRKTASKWKCSECQHLNDDDESYCMGVNKKCGVQCNVHRKAEVEATATLSWAGIFSNQNEGKWKCPVCNAFNKNNVANCAVCTNPEGTAPTFLHGGNGTLRTAAAAAAAPPTVCTVSAATLTSNGIGTRGFVLGRPTSNTTTTSGAPPVPAPPGSIGTGGFLFGNSNLTGSVGFSALAVSAPPAPAGSIGTGGATLSRRVERERVDNSSL